VCMRRCAKKNMCRAERACVCSVCTAGSALFPLSFTF
jgi:hypothetical protein